MSGAGSMSKIGLRRAERTDIDLLYKWANDPIVRTNSFNTEPIPYENHVKWFNRIMEDPNVLQFVLMDDELPVGQIRLNIDGREAEIGYSIGSEFRGKGYGHKILKLVADEVQKNHPEILSLIAKVKPENIASNRLFITEGYTTQFLCFEKMIGETDEL